jgi:hypothetical protein
MRGREEDMAGRLKAAACVLAIGLLLSGCGGSTKAAGPDVRGMALPEAKATLDDAGIGYSVKAEDGLFGIIIESNWQVCSEASVNDQMVTLHVKKHGC